MADTVIVTLRADGFCQDFELPADVKLCELYPRLLSVLQKISSRIFGKYSGIILETGGAGLLNESATLSDYGVCAGYYLDVVRKEKYDGFGQG